MGSALVGIGDAIMDSGAARTAQRNDPRKVRVMLGQRYIWNDIWRGNPRIQQPGECGDVQIIYGRDPVTNMRPYHKRKSDEKWTYNLSFRPEVGEIYLSEQEQAFAARIHPDILIEPHIKSGASPNKQWGLENWKELVNLLKRDGYFIAQMGPIGTRPMQHVEMIQTPTFRSACAVMAHCKGFVFPDGGGHHAAAAMNIPGVVIMGGFTPVELTGYCMHRNLGVSLGDACGMRVKCPHCAKEMAKITPELVLQQLKEVIRDRRDKKI